jgi:glycerol-3-phosphate dehydrogenase
MTERFAAGGRPEFDIFIIGGGINGAGIARDAAGRGYSVCLCEAADFASGTSSASTKLVHGGLRYLEHFEFRLVREALREREALLNLAPHIIRPLRFVLPYHNGLRPAWILRLGLFLYDHLGGRNLLPATTTVDLRRDETGRPLKASYVKAFEYSDCWVDDSRLVVLNLRDARSHGASIRARTRVVSASYLDGRWRVELENARTGARSGVTAGLMVNAAGPWVDEVLTTVFGHKDVNNVRLVRGSHIVVKRKFEHDKGYIFQNSDERIIFAIPFEGSFTLIGTTDVELTGRMKPPEISREEIDYLRSMADEYFREPVRETDIVWTYSGVRPLFDDGASKAQEATRDYVIRQDGDARCGVVLNVFGGKITTYRKLAEAMLAKIEDIAGRRGPPWTAGAKLPGGDFAPHSYHDVVAGYAARFPFLSRGVIERMVRLYGTELSGILDGVDSLEELGEHFGAGLYAREVEYLHNKEWASEAEDILFRRTKLGLEMSSGGVSRVGSYLNLLDMA